MIATFTQIKSEYGVPNVLVYNVGINTKNNPSVLNQQDLLNDFNVNVAGALTSSQQVIPEMIKRQKGTILFTGGMLGIKPVAIRASAAITKAGLRNLTFTLADELSPYGINVGIVTIEGVVKSGTFTDPDRIAEAYWEFFTKHGEKEILYKE